MADGGKIAQQILTEVQKDVVEPVKDELGEIIETAGQSVMGTQPTPQQLAQQREKEAEDQKKAQELRWRISQMNQTENAIAQVRHDREQKEEEQKQVDQQKKEEVQQFEVIEQQQAQEQEAVRQAKTKTEMRKGVGG